MKASALLALAALLLLASCNSSAPRPPSGPRGYSLDRAPGETRYGADGQPTDTRYLDPGDPTAAQPPPNPNDPAAAAVQPPAPTLPADGVTPPPSPTLPSTGTTAPPPVVVTPPENKPVTPPAPAASSGSYPSAIRTKPGFVKSPFDSLGREIDVRDMRSGQKARCPYTQKVFLVP
jgi:hypothetical protein